MNADQFVQESYLEEPFIYWQNTKLQTSPNLNTHQDANLFTQNFSRLFEVNNKRGTIKFKENPFHLSQSVEGYEKNYEYPQNIVIFKQLPIYSKIIFSNSKIQNLDESPRILTKQEFANVAIQPQTMKKPLNPFPLLKIFDSTIEIIEGIICRCGNSIDLKTNPIKHCPACGCSKREFFEQTMSDWFTIFSSTITNKECREFLGIENKVYISKLFSHMNLTTEGTTWNRVYHYDYQKPLFK
ncbi:hypothetical protein ACWV26_03070 [Rummeliibacillus sp. JY-2-4R]